MNASNLPSLSYSPVTRGAPVLPAEWISRDPRGPWPPWALILSAVSIIAGPPVRWIRPTSSASGGGRPGPARPPGHRPGAARPPAGATGTGTGSRAPVPCFALSPATRSASPTRPVACNSPT